MSYAELVLPEFEHEMANTRQVLRCVPDDRLDWRPHARFNTIGWNANHLAEMPGWVEGILTRTSWDIAPVGQPGHQSPALTAGQAILDLFDQNVAAAPPAIQRVSDDEVGMQWSLLEAGHTILTMPRSAVIRSVVLNHTIHHRAILCVYLRMNGIAVPGMYGPSGDETT